MSGLAAERANTPHGWPDPRGARRRLAGRLKFVKVNVDEARTAGFDVRGVPTLVATRERREVARQVGPAPADRLRAWINHLVEQAR